MVIKDFIYLSFYKFYFVNKHDDNNNFIFIQIALTKDDTF